MTRRWPVELRHRDLQLRPLHRRDTEAWQQLRRDNVAWLQEWEATLPSADPSVPVTFRGMIRSQAREARAGRCVALAIVVGSQLVGQITLGGIAWGSLRSAYIGYWISGRWAGRNITPRAVGLLTDYAFDSLKLHRVEINIRPENAASLRVVEKLGYRYEGRRPRYLHINGDWRDHLSFALLAEEVPAGGLLSRFDRQNEPQVPGSPNSGETGHSGRDTGESVN